MAAPFDFNGEVYRLIYPGWGETEAKADWQAHGDSKWADYQRSVSGGGGSQSSGQPNSKADLLRLGYKGYAGWGEAEAMADYRATGGAGKKDISVAPTPTAAPTMAAAPEFPEFPTTEQIVADIMEAQQESIDRETKWLEQYQTDNPFAFDEQLAKQSATTQYEPYYTELLEDYLSGMELKKETVQDEKKLLGEINRIQTGEATRAYERAVSQAEEGFAGQGMFYSGIKKKSLGEREVEYGAQEGERVERYGVAERGLERQTTALGLEEGVKRKQLEREQQEAVEGGVLQRRGEAMTQHYTPFLQAYKRQFPTGAGGIEGYLPETFLRY